MAFQAVPDVAEIVIEFLGNTVVSKNVLHAEKPGGYTLGDLQVLADIVDGNVGAAWLDEMSIAYAYVQVLVRGLAFENDQEATQNVSAGPGRQISAALPGNVTFAVKKTSGFTGRSARGRLFWIGLAQTHLSTNENILDPGAVIAIVDNLSSMRGSIATTVWTPVIVSRFADLVKRPVGITFPWIGESAVDSSVDSMRPRLLG